MPGVARATQDTAGGGTITSGSGDVIVNNKPAARKDDPVDPHPIFPPHDAGPQIVQGSGTVIVNNIPVARKDDSVNCGHAIESGSDDVIAGDAGGGGAAPPIGANSPPPSNASGDSTALPERQLNAAQLNRATEKQQAYEKNPNAYSVNSEGMVKTNYPGTPEIDSGEGVAPSTAAAEDIKPFLDKIMVEANNGCWRETGQNGAPSNQNIVNIWKELGINNFKSDQIAWCMGFINWVLKRTGYRYVSATLAVDIQRYSSKWQAEQITDVAQVRPGDITLFNFGGNSYHVAFVYTNTSGRLVYCGGNQSPKNKGNNPNDGDVTTTGCNPSKVIGYWRPSRK